MILNHCLVRKRKPKEKKRHQNLNLSCKNGGVCNSPTQMCGKEKCDFDTLNLITADIHQPLKY